VLELKTAEVQMIQRLRDRSKKLVIVLLSGRPLVITDELKVSDAFVAAWLPGTEGAGVVDVLVGDKPFVGKLSYTWPRTAAQLPFNFKSLATKGCDAPLFPFGYGLDTNAKTTVVGTCS
jgi:beta-glucosidase